MWSESQADDYYELLIKTCKELSQNPAIGKNYDEIAKEIFWFRVGRHIIFYRVSKPEEIEVIRILHERMDLKNRIAE
jgi:toxin ParE1/3/4